MNQEQIGKDYTKSTPQKRHKKMIVIGVATMILILAIVVLLIYSKYNASRYDKYAREAWITASTSISEFLHVATEIPRNDYCIDIDTYYELAYRKYVCISKITEFSAKTRRGEKVNTLSLQAWLSISNNVDSIISNAVRFYNNDSSEDYYQCSPEEINSLKIMFEAVPDIHDQINEEMGFYSGISRIFEIGR